MISHLGEGSDLLIKRRDSDGLRDGIEQQVVDYQHTALLDAEFGDEGSIGEGDNWRLWRLWRRGFAAICHFLMTCRAPPAR